jgi:hypothetical protein
MYRPARKVLCLFGMLCVSVLSISVYGCGGGEGSPPPDLSTRVTVTQGIWGQILFSSGDFSPSLSRGSVVPVRRKIYVYEATKISEVVMPPNEYGGFYTTIQTRLIASTESDEDGFYQFALPPGRYSLFVREGDRFYANGGGHDGTIFPVEVQAETVKKVPFGITYAASS